MPARATSEKWLTELTNLPTAAGMEDQVVSWVRRWVGRRKDLKLTVDSGGNLVITQKGRKRLPPILAVAHMDHPAFVIQSVEGDDSARFEFRGGVDAEYFLDARVGVVSRRGGTGRVVAFDPVTSTGTLMIRGDVRVGDIAMWSMRKPRQRTDIHAAPACDDLAGCAAALAALDEVRGSGRLKHFGVMLTRGEEMGFLGAIHAAKHRTIPIESRILSIETSPALPAARLGHGAIIRTGDRLTVFDSDLTNRISRAAEVAGVRHQRSLMDGGGCEATVFGAFGYQAAGLCMALRHHHNRGHMDEPDQGLKDAVPKYEEISLSDFHGLVELLVVAASAVDVDDSLRSRLESLYESKSYYLT